MIGTPALQASLNPVLNGLGTGLLSCYKLLVPDCHWNPFKGTNTFFAGAGPEVLQHPRARGYREQCDRALHGLEHRLSEALFTMVLHWNPESDAIISKQINSEEGFLAD